MQQSIDSGVHKLLSASLFYILYPCAELKILLQQMAPAKQAKIIQEFRKQSAQMDMTVR